MKFDRLSLFTGAVLGALIVPVATGLGLGTTAIDAQAPTVDQQIAELHAQHDAMQTGVQRAQVMTVTYQLDNAGFHTLDESTAAGTIPAGALGAVRRSRIAVQATSWPPALRDTTSQMVDQMTQLEAALRVEDALAAAGPAHEVHELGHTLSDQAYAWLASGAASAVAAPASAPADHDHDASDHDHN